MSAREEDYRTNRADFANVAGGRFAADGVRDELAARKKKTLWLKDQRTAKLAENPLESLPQHKVRPRG
ncbi:hypothetical protein [Mesorhizobium sp. INR15]|uniref:hypothetical protein n=1 Tax=Mesorhizobium sp. INR15 TaxID=2654248 RepID=UPI00189655FD|nr:hypothetical protein [Mesorhizobium sp. INR15]QPC95688.1 hypothetical protein GA829_34430 [Mesorhizobium sp. INR15]QPC96054.1 hypothetical protein GA829_36655 [Mesorhizobium sp. INR15]